MKEFHIQWHITSRCNLRCAHCYQDSFTDNDELKWPELRRICDNILQAMERHDMRLTVALTGGEPFLKGELWDIVDYLSSSVHVSNISIITNGTVVDKYIYRVREYPILDEIYVSLDGVRPSTNDSIRPGGTFEKVISNIEVLKSYGLSVFVMFTLMRRNVKDAEGLLDFCRHLRLDGFILERFIPLGRGKKVMDELLTPQQLKGLYREIFSQCGLEYSEREGAKSHALKVEIGKDGDPNLYGAECIVARDGYALLPDGTVLPCRRFFHPLGNLLNQALSDIWEHSVVLGKLRDRRNLQGACRDCGIEECRGCRALAYSLTGNYLSQDPLCRLVLRR